MKRIKNFVALSFALIAVSFVSVNAESRAYSAPPAGKTIEQQIFKEILTLPRYGVFDHIAFQLNGSTVTLSGKVYSLGTKSGAANAVRRIPGVTRVVNNIEELPPSPFDDSIRRRTLRALADKGLYRYFWEPNPSIRIIVDRGHVSLEGYVMNRGDYNLANIVANGVSGVFSVTNNLVIGKLLS